MPGTELLQYEARSWCGWLCLVYSPVTNRACWQGNKRCLLQQNDPYRPIYLPFDFAECAAAGLRKHMPVGKLWAK